MLQSLLNLLESVFGAFVNTLNGIGTLFTSLVNSSTLVFTVVQFMPAVVAAAVTTSAALLIIKLVLGR